MIYKVKRGGNYGWSVMEGPQPVHVEGRRGPAPILPPIEGASPLRGGVDHRRLRVSRDASARAGRRLHLRRLSDRDRLVAPDAGGTRSSSTGSWPGRRSTSSRSARTATASCTSSTTTGRTRSIGWSATRPRTGKSDFPRRLSQTGLFASTRDHRPAPGVIPYAVNAELWADGATAERFLAVPGEGRVGLDEQGNWRFPEGSVLVRTVSSARGKPASRRRVETQLLHLLERRLAAVFLRLGRRPGRRGPGRCRGDDPDDRDRRAGRAGHATRIIASMPGPNASSATIPGSRRRRRSTASSRPRRWASTRPR